MSGRTVDAVSPEAAELGEGPRWDAGRGEFVWVDVLPGIVRRAGFDNGALRTVAEHRAGRPVGAIAPVASGSGLLLAAGAGFAYLDGDGVVHELAGAGPEDGSVRMNDGACDPTGRFLAGTMAYDATPGAGALYRLDVDATVSTVRERTTISNGIAWSADGRTMYWVDSGPGDLWALPYDAEAGVVGEGRLLVDADPTVGTPDGLCVDDEGCLWVAIWGAGVVRRYAPDGRQIEEVPMPVRQPSACALVGTALLVTSARLGLDAEALAREPDAGRVFAVDVGVTGPAATPYRGVLVKG